MSEPGQNERWKNEGLEDQGVDARIDRALVGLREAQAPAGMEARMLAAVKAAETRQARQIGQFRQIGQVRQTAQTAPIAASAGSASAWSLVWGSLAAGVAVAVFAGAAFVGVRNHGVASPIASRAGLQKARQESVVKAAPEPAQSIVAVASRRESDRSAGIRSQPRLLHGSSFRSDSAGPAQSSVKKTKFYPAPPAPLSQQELVLIALVRSERLEDLAMLDPVARERETARGDAEFEQFIQSRREEVHP